MAKRWPDKANQHRKKTIEAMQRIRFLIDDTKGELYEAQYKADANLSEMEALASDVERRMVLAYYGE